MVHRKLVFIISLGFLSCCTQKPTDRPNVIIFLADDAGYADFGFQGDHRYVTPNLDEIARDGIRFTNAYVSASVCSPSRAGLLTGRHQNRFGLEFNLYGMGGEGVPLQQRGLPLSESTLGNLLQDAGYVTGIIGKWSLGRHEDFYPVSRGFSEFFGILGDQSAYLPGKATRVVSSFKKVDSKKLPYLTDAFADESLEFIERHKNQRFFLYLSFNAPHAPLQPRADYLRVLQPIFGDENRAANAAMTQSMDESIGRIMNKLKQLNLFENTIIIFTNDNGGALSKNGSSNAPLRGSKGTVFEGGVRAPFLMQWPSALPKGETIDFPISTLDILPTVAGAIGSVLPRGRAYDGVDLIPYLKGQIKQQPHDMLFWRSNWAAAVRKGEWKLIRTPKHDYLLFNLDDDIGETMDLSSAQPEIVASLRLELNTWEATLAQPLWEPDPMWKTRVLQAY